ncbi:hypothetical protein ILUMI_25452 [Ignelater luminosus]|uniref:Uncharacterized protein n=1 Tax=Ignelater luminosus TaxID=2038154 RepID=A0A8K0FW88_IGNLU|nr:hypothetical protein ILUMI_25452 [Ignelater luminosus]
MAFDSYKLHAENSSTQGRAPTIPADQENRLAEALKTMKQWGFGITKLEVLNIVAEFTRFSHDPSKTKIVGAKGKPSSRTTSSSGRENTTVLSAVSVSGGKADVLERLTKDTEKSEVRSPKTSSSASSGDDLIHTNDSDEDCNPEMYEEDNKVQNKK